MDVLHVRNVNHAYQEGRALLSRVGERQTSRGGDVLVAPHPVMTVYDRPCERVLFDDARDANPFFHLFESIWMLAGRNDSKFLDNFVRDFGSRYAEEDGTIWGAYGYRWTHNFEIDQIESCIQRLHRDPLDRRVVIQMWDPLYDLAEPEGLSETTGWADQWPDREPRDVPCNTQIYLRIRREQSLGSETGAPLNATLQVDRSVLDLTVMCRSNDIVWGAYGANAVHFSFLQEYTAARLGVAVGKMYQLSNNWHGYLSVLSQMPTPDRVVDPYMERQQDYPIRIVPMQMVTVPSEFVRDCRRFCELNQSSVYANTWFRDVASRMLDVHSIWRAGGRIDAMGLANTILADDWRIACQRWLSRRVG